jgi:hypothetical protein
MREGLVVQVYGFSFNVDLLPYLFWRSISRLQLPEMV